MKKRSLIVAVLVIAALLLATIPAAASTPADITITAVMYPNPEIENGPMSGTFSITGDDGAPICSSGTIQDIENPAHGWQSDQVIVLHVHKHFACDGGTFEMNMQVFIGPDGITAHWVILGGEGDYAGLHGTGVLSGTWEGDEEGTLIDVYSGKVHLE